MKLTPKEKAKELYTLFSKHAKYWDCYNDSPLEIDHTKQCVLIAIDEIIKSLENYGKESDELQNMENDFRYWQEVKEELLKM